MADTIDELYSKYTSQVGEALEDDRYFQYLFEMIQAGDNTLQQKNRVLHKVVDERWLTVVEDGIKAIFNIVDKPRRFIATAEEVVPVALAKKITADSVRHLSQNTQFIAQNSDGEIHPTKILNVTTEESFDLYENRFVYHLIQRLFAFVDKRTDVIFWSTGDETCNVMSMESKVDDAYEQISYKVEMTIKNRQSYVENDDDHMDIFKRIDHVRRMSRVLRTSSFCDIMNGCAKVRSPIQRTNLMMKDPDYRTCYKLWQFIESYDEVGYTIEERDSTMEFDEEYLLQMYINMITNYTVFKSLLEADPRRLTELASKKREPVKPKFIKEIKEEIVEDRNIPDVEIRQVFVEEVTQAQLEAEARLQEETERREQLEKSVNNLEWQVESLNQEMEIAGQTSIQLEEEKEYLMTQLETETTTRKKAEEAVLQAQEEAKKNLEQAQAEAQKNLEQVQAEARQHVEQLQNEHEQYVTQIKSEADRQIVQVKNDASVQIQQIRDAAAQDIEKAIAEENNAKDIAKKTIEDNNALNEKVKATLEQITALEEQLERIRRESAEAISKVEREKEEAVTKAEKEREEAIAKAEANSLSHYIVNALQKRKERKKSKEDDSEK